MHTTHWCHRRHNVPFSATAPAPREGTGQPPLDRVKPRLKRWKLTIFLYRKLVVGDPAHGTPVSGSELRMDPFPGSACEGDYYKWIAVPEVIRSLDEWNEWKSWTGDTSRTVTLYHRVGFRLIWQDAAASRLDALWANSLRFPLVFSVWPIFPRLPTHSSITRQ